MAASGSAYASAIGHHCCRLHGTFGASPLFPPLLAPRFGGDVVKFAGDALLVVFAIETRQHGASHQRQHGAFADERSATIVAAACAHRTHLLMD